MVCTPDHQDAVIAPESIHLVQEEAAHSIGDDAVEVFEDQVTRRFLPGFLEDQLQRELGRGVTAAG